jgi:hypothetical protein
LALAGNLLVEMCALLRNLRLEKRGIEANQHLPATDMIPYVSENREHTIASKLCADRRFLARTQRAGCSDRTHERPHFHCHHPQGTRRIRAMGLLTLLHRARTKRRNDHAPKE